MFVQAVMVIETDRDLSLFVLDHHVDPVTKLHARVWFGKGGPVRQLDAMPATFKVIEENHVVADLKDRPSRGQLFTLEFKTNLASERFGDLIEVGNGFEPQMVVPLENLHRLLFRLEFCSDN